MGEASENTFKESCWLKGQTLQSNVHFGLVSDSSAKSNEYIEMGIK